MDVRKILEEATKREASDIFIIAGRPLTYKSKGAMNTLDDQRMEPKDTFQFVSAIYTLAERNIDDFDRTGDDDFSFAIPGVSRFRVSTFKQRGSYSAVIRVISFTLPHPSELGIPDAVMELADSRSGMILVTGPAGSGKSTTLACLIDKINHEREAHIITLEDPLEFLHRHEKSIVSQREINTDTENYLTALRAALRQSPDVILLGEMRDYETINTAVTAAETGHLIFSSLHTIGAANTIDRIIDVFPASQQHQISIQLASVLQAVVSQKLVPSVSADQVDNHIGNNTNRNTFCNAVHQWHGNQTKICRNCFCKILKIDFYDCRYHKETNENKRWCRCKSRNCLKNRCKENRNQK